MDKEKDKVAAMVSIVPTFEPPQPQEVIYSNEVPESVSALGSQLLYLFLIDCSGSMAGSRINTTKEALKLFIQSLPFGCKFALLRFGSTSQYILNDDQGKVWDYNNET